MVLKERQRQRHRHYAADLGANCGASFAEHFPERLEEAALAFQFSPMKEPQLKLCQIANVVCPRKLIARFRGYVQPMAEGRLDEIAQVVDDVRLRGISRSESQ